MIDRYVLSLFYPGTRVWIKRHRHLLFMFFAGPTLFLNDIQTQLFVAGEKFVSWSDERTRPAVSVAEFIGDHISSNTIKEGVQKMRSYQTDLQTYGILLRVGCQALKYGSYIFWIVFAYSAFWLACDVRLGNARLFVMTTLALAFVFNIYAYVWLHLNLERLNSFFNF